MDNDRKAIYLKEFFSGDFGSRGNLLENKIRISIHDGFIMVSTLKTTRGCLGNTYDTQNETVLIESGYGLEELYEAVKLALGK